MPATKLTNTSVEKLSCPPGQRYAFFWDTNVKGLGVRVNEAGTVRTYVFLYRVKGSRQERQITIGRHNDPYRIDQARDRAMALKMQMREGIDPVLQAKQKADQEREATVLTRAQTITLMEVMTHYLQNHRTSHRAPLRPATQKDIERHINGNLGDWAGEPVASITRDACTERFHAIAENSEAQAEQCFAYLRSLLNYAKEMFETEDGEFPLLAVNPVQRMFKKVKPAKQEPRDVRIPLNRVRAVWTMLQKRRMAGRLEIDRTCADWISFIMLTGTRRGESGSLTWANVDFDARTFHLPGDIVKNHRGITFPMSTVLHQLLSERLALAKAQAEARRRDLSPYVFHSASATGYVNQAQATMEAVSEVAGNHIQIHDLRRTFVDVCAEVGVSSNSERLLLNHISGDVHDRHYANSKLALAADVERVAEWIAATPA